MPTRAGGGPTMRDVAREAGVSKALVSIVFRGAPGASAETRARVFATAERLGYRANRPASLLALSRTRQIGVVISLHDFFHAELADAAIAAADEAGYRVVLSPWTSTHGEAHAITTALDFRCEALILVGPRLVEADITALTAKVATVCVGRELDIDSIDVVRTAEDDGMEQVVDHLAGLGHRRIAHADGGQDHIAAARRAGFEQGIRRLRLRGRSAVVRGGRTEDDGRRAARQLLRRSELPTAVAAFNDHCALGVIDGLAEAGLRVPADVSVTGYDDSYVARLKTVDLTSVRQDTVRVARWAVAAAIERLDSGRGERREAVLRPHLIARGTSAPP